MAFEMDNRSGSIRIKNLYYHGNLPKPSMTGTSFRNSRSSPVAPDYEERQPEFEGQRRGQVPFYPNAGERGRNQAARDSGYASWCDENTPVSEYSRYPGPNPGPETYPEQHHAHHPYGFHNRGGSDAAGRGHNDAENRQYDPEYRPSEQGQYEPNRYPERGRYHTEGSDHFQSREGMPYRRERYTDRDRHVDISPQRFPPPDLASYPQEGGRSNHQNANADPRHEHPRDTGQNRYTSPSPSIDPPSIPPDDRHYEGDGDTDNDNDYYSATGPDYPPSPPRYNYEASHGRNWFNNQGPDPWETRRQDDGDRDNSDMSSVAGPARRSTPSMNDGSSGTRAGSPPPGPNMLGDNPWSNVSAGDSSQVGAADIHRQCRLRNLRFHGQIVCRLRRGGRLQFCRGGTADRRSR